LGWMMPRTFWDKELRANWPPGFWDDWLRKQDQRKNRTCIYPEVNRVYTFGREGSSGGQFFEEFLAKIKLNDIPIDFSKLDLSYLPETRYDPYLASLLRRATVMGSLADVDDWIQKHRNIDAKNRPEFAIDYVDLRHLTGLLAQAQLMTDHKELVPRASYKGIVPFRRDGFRVFLRPHDWASRLDRGAVNAPM